MDIQQIWMSQRSLRRMFQVEKMVSDLLEGGLLPQITLHRDDDGEIQLRDGHHRLTAIWLSGRRRLEPYEYIVVDTDYVGPRFGKVTDLIQRM